MTVHVIGPGCALAVVGATLVVRDITAPTPSTIETLSETFRSLAEAEPGGFVVLYITGPSENGQLPDEPSRKAVLATLRAHKDNIRALGYVVLLRGILAATMRSVGSALLYAARIPFPTRIFGDLDEGIGWICDTSATLGVPEANASELRTACAEILARLAEDSPATAS